MTNEKTIKVLKDMIPKTCKMVNGRYVGGFEDTECPQFEAIQVAVEALDKQIPKKPILDTIFPSGVKWWRCSICGHNNIETNDRFCHNCGQKLDWSKDI